MNDVNLLYNVFHKNLSDILNKHAPLKSMTKSQLKLSEKPWISDTIIHMIKEKNEHYGIFRRTGDMQTFA